MSDADEWGPGKVAGSFATTAALFFAAYAGVGRPLSARHADGFGPFVALAAEKACVFAALATIGIWVARRRRRIRRSRSEPY